MTDMKGQSALRSKSDDVYFSDRPNGLVQQLLFCMTLGKSFHSSEPEYVHLDLKVRKPMGAS